LQISCTLNTFSLTKTHFALCLSKC